jgi:hypothetical protein
MRFRSASVATARVEINCGGRWRALSRCMWSVFKFTSLATWQASQEWGWVDITASAAHSNSIYCFSPLMAETRASLPLEMTPFNSALPCWITAFSSVVCFSKFSVDLWFSRF